MSSKENTIMKVIIIATNNPKATCHPHKLPNLDPNNPTNIMAIARSKQNSEKCHEQNRT